MRRGGLVEFEGGAHVALDVFAHRGAVDLVGGDAVQQPAGLFGALGGVLGQVAGDLAALLPGGELREVELAAPLDAAAAEFVGDRRADVLDRRADGVLEQPASEPHGRRVDLVSPSSALAGTSPTQKST